MNQPTPPPNQPAPDSRPDGDTPAGSEPDAPRADRAEPLWEEPKPTGADAAGPSGAAGREEPRPAEGTARPDDARPSDDPRVDDAGYGPSEPRRRHPLQEHLTNKGTWLRLVFIVIFGIIWGITELVLTAVVVLQFLWVLFNGQPNERLRAFGQSLARYAYQLFRYVTFNSDARPFPFDLDWPSGKPDPASD